MYDLVPVGPAVQVSCGEVAVPDVLQPLAAGPGADAGNVPPLENPELVTAIVRSDANVPGTRSGANAPPTYCAFPTPVFPAEAGFEPVEDDGATDDVEPPLHATIRRTAATAANQVRKTESVIRDMFSPRRAAACFPR
jgi:hypothetical protein